VFSDGNNAGYAETIFNNVLCICYIYVIMDKTGEGPLRVNPKFRLGKGKSLMGAEIRFDLGITRISRHFDFILRQRTISAVRLGRCTTAETRSSTGLCSRTVKSPLHEGQWLSLSGIKGNQFSGYELTEQRACHLPQYPLVCSLRTWPYVQGVTILAYLSKPVARTNHWRLTDEEII